MLSPVDKVGFGEYPKVLVDHMNENDQQYKIVMQAGKPYIRIDSEDKEMLDYKPTSEDKAWEEKHLG